MEHPFFSLSKKPDHRGILPMKRLDDIPVWLFALLTVAAFDAAALGGLVCTRRWGDWFGPYPLVDKNTVGWIFSAILVMYAIALGLIAVATLGERVDCLGRGVTASVSHCHTVSLFSRLSSSLAERCHAFPSSLHAVHHPERMAHATAG